MFNQRIDALLKKCKAHQHIPAVKDIYNHLTNEKNKSYFQSPHCIVFLAQLNSLEPDERNSQKKRFKKLAEKNLKTFKAHGIDFPKALKGIENNQYTDQDAAIRDLSKRLKCTSLVKPYLNLVGSSKTVGLFLENAEQKVNQAIQAFNTQAEPTPKPESAAEILGEEETKNEPIVETPKPHQHKFKIDNIDLDQEKNTLKIRFIAVREKLFQFTLKFISTHDLYAKIINTTPEFALQSLPLPPELSRIQKGLFDIQCQLNNPTYSDIQSAIDFRKTHDTLDALEQAIEHQSKQKQKIHAEIDSQIQNIKYRNLLPNSPAAIAKTTENTSDSETEQLDIKTPRNKTGHNGRTSPISIGRGSPLPFTHSENSALARSTTTKEQKDKSEHKGTDTEEYITPPNLQIRPYKEPLQYQFLKSTNHNNLIAPTQLPNQVLLALANNPDAFALVLYVKTQQPKFTRIQTSKPKPGIREGELKIGTPEPTPLEKLKFSINEATKKSKNDFEKRQAATQAMVKFFETAQNLDFQTTYTLFNTIKTESLNSSPSNNQYKYFHTLSRKNFIAVIFSLFGLASLFKTKVDNNNYQSTTRTWAECEKKVKLILMRKQNKFTVPSIDEKDFLNSQRKKRPFHRKSTYEKCRNSKDSTTFLNAELEKKFSSEEIQNIASAAA